MYDSPRQFEPLLPSLPAPELDELAEQVCRRGFELKRLIHPLTEARMAQLLRSINSYYSHRIEGQHTHPREIERALKRNFSKEPDKARLQRLALAHIETQQEMEGWLASAPDTPVYSPGFLARLHESFYGRLTEEDRVTKEGDRIVPGKWRERGVHVGRHVAPAFGSVPRFLEQAEEVYSTARGLARKLIAIACAHHRLAWVHPFRDGNGRVIRLQSQAALLQHGAGSGLWAVSRGLARSVETYYARLADADAPRRGDLDGRGSLSEAGLVAFAGYFLETSLDQLTFMAELLDLTRLRDRVRAYIVFLSETEDDIRPEVEPALYHVFLAGSAARGEFKQMTGLRSRTADKVIAALLRRGLLESASPKGAVGIGLPLDALAFYFPRLYPEAAT